MEKESKEVEHTLVQEPSPIVQTLSPSDDSLDKGGKVKLTIILIVRFLLLVAFLGALINNRTLILYISALAFFVTFLPSLINKKWGVKIPGEFEVITILFIYGTLFIGEVRGIYSDFWWWDILLNLASSIALGFVGLTILYVLYKDEKIDASPLVIAFFTFTFALALGTVWEIFEFALDSFLGTNMQKSGLNDTLGDLMVNAIGSLAVAVGGYYYIRDGKIKLISSILSTFVDKNPLLFRSSKSKEISKIKVLELIRKGESRRLEFKSTIRKNLHTKQTDKKIEHSVLKTITAFLNSTGGTLLVGVSDKGKITGIEEDGFESHDKFNLHLTNLIKQKLSGSCLHLIHFNIVQIDENHVLRVDCKESDKPIFLREDDEEVFYIRSGPSSAKLTGRALVDYIGSRFTRE